MPVGAFSKKQDALSSDSGAAALGLGAVVQDRGAVSWKGGAWIYGRSERLRSM